MLNLRVLAPLSRLACLSRGWLLLSGRGFYWNGLLKVLTLQVLALLSSLAFIGFFIGAWLLLEWISKTSEVGFYYRARLVLECISKSSEFVGVGSAVEVGLYYWGLACVGMDFYEF